MVRQRSENQIQREILDYLKLRNIPATRNQSGRVRVGSYWVNLGPAGWPDVITVISPDGQFLGIECKKPGEKLKPAQVKCKAEIEAAGGMVVVATCVEDVINAL